MALVLIHRGASPYLQFSLRQARHISPESEVVLLGDASNADFPATTHVDLGAAQYAQATAALDASYRHLSTNRRKFEEVCFQRWFWLREWMRQSGTVAVWVMDSDVMLYASEAELDSVWGEGASFALQRPQSQRDYRWVAPGSVSYWTREVLDAFCGFVLSGYEAGSPLAAQYDEKWAHHRQTGEPGGVCDMTALHLFAERRGGGVANLCEVRGDVTIDLNMGSAENLTPDEYRMAGGLKEVRWRGRQPYGCNQRLGREVRFQALHFQGPAKAVMPWAYRGPSFSGRWAASWRTGGYFRMRRLGARLLGPAVRKLRG